MARLPRILPLIAIAIGGVVAVRAVGVAPGLFDGAKAWAEEDTPEEIGEEVKRRIRIGIGNFQALVRHPRQPLVLYRGVLGVKHLDAIHTSIRQHLYPLLQWFMCLKTEQHRVRDVGPATCRVNDSDAFRGRQAIDRHKRFGIISKIGPKRMMHIVAMTIGNQPLSDKFF